MAKYSFKVYLEDESSRVIVPSTMKETDLHDMDKFVCEQGDYFSLCKNLASELEIESYKIKKIMIIRNKKELEFALMTNNEYLTPVLDDLYTRVIKGDRPYEIKATVVSGSNPSYVEMRKYLLNNLNKDHNLFLKEIYNYNNEFSRLLNRYGIICSQGEFHEDDYERQYLERIISEELRIYKNYRGLCRCRKKYEERISSYTSNCRNLKVNKEMNMSPNYNLNKEFPSVKELTLEYNQEYEEFLDEEEFQSMTSEDSLPKGYK